MAWPDLARMVDAAGVSAFGSGHTITYTPKVGQPFSLLRGVFDAAHEGLNLQDGIPVSTTEIVLGVHLADFPSPPVQGDQVTVNGDTFEVAEVRPDDPEAGAELLLVKPLA